MESSTAEGFQSHQVSKHRYTTSEWCRKQCQHRALSACEAL